MAGTMSAMLQWPLVAAGHCMLEGAATGSNYYPSLIPVVPFQRVLPDTLGEPLHWKFEPRAHGTTTHTQPVAAALLQGAFVLGPAGTILTKDRKLVYDASLEVCLTPDTHSICNRVIYAKPRRLSGLSLNLTASQAHENYFHWVTDALPKLALAQAAGYNLSDFDHFIVNSHSRAFQQETLTLLGIPTAKIVALDEHPVLQCAKLLVTTAPCLSGNVSPWMIRFLRDSFLTGNVVTGQEKIFIGRKNTVRRSLLNESAISAALEQQGFKTVYPETLSFAQQVSLFAGAKVIIAAHGAALTNLAFAAPGTRVLELFPSSYINQGYWTMASVAGLHYAYAITPVPEIPGNHDLLRNVDFAADLTKIIEFTKKLNEFHPLHVAPHS